MRIHRSLTLRTLQHCIALVFGLALVAGAVVIPAPRTASAADVSQGKIWDTWARTDKLVADLQESRTWMWGPEALSGPLQEPYISSPGGQRTVQYFDKSRMEITDPAGDQNSLWYVTNGLLAREMITGNLQTGPESHELHSPAQVNVAGDNDDPDGPTYATFNSLMSHGALPEGHIITQTLNRAGEITNSPELAQHGVSAAVYVNETQHTVASVFWDFMTSAGRVYSSSGISDGALFENAFYATGFPLTEAYWTTARVGGTPKQVLVQVFERRVLTYTPDNSDGWKVEAGNVGLHYYAWRYGLLNKQPVTSPVVDAEDAACLETFEAEFLGLINAYRLQHGLGVLANSRTLNIASHNHSLDMGQRNYFSHTTPEGKLPWDRMSEAGYAYNTTKGENIAAGQRSAQQVFDAWKNSPGHNENMLKPEFTVIGIGLVRVPDSAYDYYWTTKFGGHIDAAPDC